MEDRREVLVVGAGILGLASAFHILRGHGETELTLVDMLGGVGRGNTAKSAAAYRDMFTSPINRRLAQGSITYYEKLAERGGTIGLRRIGYLWLLEQEQILRYRGALEYLRSVGSIFDLLEPNELSRLLPGYANSKVVKGVLGSRCGILNQNLLSAHYEREIIRMGGKILTETKVTDLIADPDGRVEGVMLGDKEIRVGTLVMATGAWMDGLMERIGLKVPVVPKKRQLFSIRAKGDDMNRLLNAHGFNSHGLLPFTILPKGAYLRPAANSIIVGFSDQDRNPGIEDGPEAEIGFYNERIRPQIVESFPFFDKLVPEHSWAGHYAYHPSSNTPFVHHEKGVILVGGASGSGIMKADSIGRVAAGILHGRKDIELGDGNYMKAKELDLEDRQLEEEELMI